MHSSPRWFTREIERARLFRFGHQLRRPLLRSSVRLVFRPLSKVEEASLSPALLRQFLGVGGRKRPVSAVPFAFLLAVADLRCTRIAATPPHEPCF